MINNELARDGVDDKDGYRCEYDKNKAEEPKHSESTRRQSRGEDDEN